MQQGEKKKEKEKRTEIRGKTDLSER